ncbi:hypothetical protein JH06_3330 [Blastocystis sp. subtype 4]|uniref:hypothetical protein n=1 Tax=Blastocystis sp. subtype 4 TaxID=944170 RepID=UPI000711DFB8|nr:hypothetical protein JH06_3330 [Blastocystis sp. subtype 4]KNB43129.1 hypothetical protein JH06_3330 [Blastocystis sp. subtype 4]|eukprot:XP_014526572.1 hypothetical protein JH06_3330 [Blastocystis sp. subtype 4]
MSRAAFSSFARNMGRAQFMRAAAMSFYGGMKPQFVKMTPSMKTMRSAFPDVFLKNEQMTQLTKLANRSRRLCVLQFQKLQIGALSVLLTTTGDILIDFKDFFNSVDELDDEELLRRTSLLVQTLRLVSLFWCCLCTNN